MEDIRLYNLNFELLAIAHKVKSSAWEVYYNKSGTFEAHISIDKWMTPAVFDNKYLVAVEGSKQAFCHARQINTEIVLYGKTLNWLLSKRTVMPFNTARDGIINNPVTLCNKLVTDVFINSRSIEDAYGNSVTIPGVSNMEVVDNGSEFVTSADMFYRTAAHPLSEVIIDRLAADHLGHRLIFDVSAKKWRFEIYEGAINPIVLSKSNRSMYSLDYTVDISNVCNAGYYQPTEQAETTASDESTEEAANQEYEQDQVYKFVADDSYNTDFEACNAICQWDTILNGSYPSEALGDLSDNVKTEEITGTVAHLEYGIDYQLGDVMRVQIVNEGLSRTLMRRITGVKLYRESNEVSAEPILEED